MHWLKQAGEGAVGIDVGRGRDADGAGAGRAEIGKNVAKQIAGDHHVEPVGVQHEVGGENVDMILVDADLRVVLAHRLDALVPVGHGDGDAVGFGGGGKVFFRAAVGQLVGELQDAVDADARHHGLLDHHFALGAGEHGAANAGVFSFGIFTHDVKVDVARFAVRQRRFNAGH
ncbi:hypothetical protein HA46_13715 [Pantoea septica]|uniref:Uncharacterized protein n=1 Tax=Pantoea septica TaxID=472695 RepID=A0ABX3UQ88_9GAMM|nr:hypothetical protein HA46_13715 [Pantoea septica]